MTSFWIGTILLVLFAAAMATITAWARNDHPARWVALALFLASAPLAGATFGKALGHHRPIVVHALLSGLDAAMARRGAYREPVKGIAAMLLGHKMVEGVGIYLYLDQEGEPLPLVLPWSQKAAQELQDALDEAGPTGGVRVEIPFENWLNQPEVPTFRPLPQPKFLPDKPRGAPPVQVERGA